LNNELIECKKCTRLVHKLCNDPPLTNDDIDSSCQIKECGKCNPNNTKQKLNSKTNVNNNNNNNKTNFFKVKDEKTKTPQQQQQQQQDSSNNKTKQNLFFKRDPKVSVLFLINLIYIQNLCFFFKG
jgi:hypothetical protein